MKISGQEKLPIAKDKILGTDEEFYDYFKHLVIRINNKFSKIQNAINYPRAVARLSRSSIYDTSANGGANSWITLPLTNKDRFSGEIAVSSDDKTITLRNEGHYLISFNITFKNDAGTSLDTYAALRFTKNGTEVHDSGIMYQVKENDGWHFTVGGCSTLIRASVGDTLQFQYRVGDTDINPDPLSYFDDPRCAVVTILQTEA